MEGIEILEGVLGRWLIVLKVAPDWAWNGSNWSPHYQGIPVGRSQICNCGSVHEAIELCNFKPRTD